MDEEYVLELLHNQGFIDADQLESLRQKLLEGKKDLVTLLEENKILTENDLLQILAAEYGMDTFDLTDYKIPEDVIQMMPADVAKRFKVVPVMRHENTLTVAVSDPIHAVEILDSLSYVLHCDVVAVVASRDQIRRAINTYYGTTDEAVQAIIEEVTQSDVDIEFTNQNQNLRDADAEGDDAPIIRLVSLIIINAYNSRASDIHLEPLEKRFRVRYRIDGILHEVDSPPKYLQNNVIQRVKIMAKLDIAEKRIPQDGRIMFKLPGKVIDLRVSSIPTVHGESIVMRILDKSSIQLGIPELGFFHDDQQLINRIINMPDGIFLVTGPTGSGKTTSLYAFLNTLNTPNRKIITAEDPVEYELSGINQVQCDKERMTFAKALRAMLRQAPNIIMVGEIRDIETGAIAINAALTGHLVFSTLHTNDAPTAVTRLIEMGVKPFLIASALRAVMAQRLVRRVCKNCAVPTTPTPEELRVLELDADYFKDAHLMKGQGCNQCKLGYKGRIGIYEIFVVEETIVQLIFRSATIEEIRQRARELGMRTLREDGLRKAAAGITTLEEVIWMTKASEELVLT